MLQNVLSGGRVSFNNLLAVSLAVHIIFWGAAHYFHVSNRPLPHLQSIAVELESLAAAEKKEKTAVRELPSPKAAAAEKKHEATIASRPAVPVQRTAELSPAKEAEMPLPAAAKTATAVQESAALLRQPATAQQVLPGRPSSPAATIAGPAAAQLSAISREYNSRIRALIDRQKEYPLMARRSGTEGTVYIRFVITRDGRLKQAEVSRSSGRRILDNAAVNAVNRVSRFPSVPDSMEGAELSFELPLAYKLAEN